jgi:tetratricopeptide (TPR) repeat protein
MEYSMDKRELSGIELFRQAQQRATEYYLEFIRQHRTNFDALAVEFQNILSMMSICLDQQDNNQFADYFDLLRSFMVERSYDDEFLRCSRIVLEQNLLQGEQVALLGQMAEIEEDRGNYEEARKTYRKQLEKVRNDTQSKGKGIIYRILSEIARLAVLQADDVDAVQVLEDKLEVAQKRGSYKEQVNALYELGKLSLKIGNLEEADALSLQGLETSKRIEYRVGEIDILMLQGAIQFGMKKFRSAFEWYEEALHHALAMNDQTRSNETRSQMEVLNTIMGKQIFISYSHHDRVFGERLVNDLKTAGFSVWWDELEIKVGHSIIKKVSEGIGESAFFAVALSPKSVKSDFVQHELETALMGQLSGKKIRVLPLLISDCKIPAFLQVLKWADFRNDYESGLRELLDRLSDVSIDD